MYHLHEEPLPSWHLTSSVWMKYGGRKQIYTVLSGNWDGGSLHAVVNRTYWCTIPHHKCENWVIFSQRPAHNNQPLECHTQSAWWYMLKQTSILNNEWEIWRKLYFCNMAVWTKVCTDRKQWKLGDIFQLNTTINLTPTLSERWEILMDNWDSVSAVNNDNDWTSSFNSIFLSKYVCWFTKSIR